MEHFAAIAQSKSSDELLKMVYEWDAWSPALLQEVEKELAARNLLPDNVATLRGQRIEEEAARLAIGKEASTGGLVVGWLLCFGLLGIGVGYHYAYSKIPSKFTGETFYKYNEVSRKNGRMLLYVSLLLSACLLIYKFLPNYPI